MNFRQRIAWVCLGVYLTGTIVFAYYVFEIRSQYTVMADQHVQLHHSDTTRHVSVSWLDYLWSHLTDVPFSVWLIVVAVPYVQIFCLLYMCTRPEPKLQLLRFVIPVAGCCFMSQKAAKRSKTLSSTANNGFDSRSPFVCVSNFTHHEQITNIL